MKTKSWVMLPIVALAGIVPFAAAPAQAPVAPTVGLIGLGLNVADIDRATDFYVKGLGMQALSRIPAGNNLEQFLSYPATPYPANPAVATNKPPMLELIGPKVAPGTAPAPSSATPAPGKFKIVLSVNNAEALNAQLKAAGYAPPPVRFNQQAGGGSFVMKDPDGNTVELVQQGKPSMPAPVK